MTYAYVALDPSGRKRSGTVSATSREAAMELVAQDGRFLLTLGEDAAERKQAEAKHGKVSRADLSLFTRRLSDLAAAGLPLDRVISVIAEQSESATLSAICGEVLDEVRSGKSVSDALAMHPRYFNDIFVQTLRAGEASGQFPEVAARLAEFQETEVARRSQIVAALTYPAILAGVAVLVILAMLTFVIPKLSGVFKSIGSELPISTRILMSMTGLLTTKGVYLLAGVVAVVLLYRWWSRTEAGATVRDRFFLNAPIVGKVVGKAVVSRYARILGTLIYGGVPILQSLELAGLAAGNKIFRHSSDLVEADVREGHAVAAAMKDAGAFPPVLVNMVAVGEETGNLPLMLSRVSNSLDFEVDIGVRRLVSLVEPLIIVFMAIFVGFVVISIFIPLYQSGDTIK